MKQQTLAGFEKFGKTTRRAQFLSDLDRIVPWEEDSGRGGSHEHGALQVLIGHTRVTGTPPLA